ncbi:imidazole glycerol phosphate synthase subunit HisH [Actinomycetospora cinnamomea]|uniref:Imidazole glycerol phosphate synthase subunit HisH n=1 Tax=Actinomycetospora cinnamomea TaxID=663609 RepID=A0A2U1FI93_9PSEU|nr:imidazole glycerol phosphate synthase subunit HisH [Actinomycetospora cinnamomea]PVZ11906.1 glutamine amidotransferase [Actinomycetospora cinnamomea]
MTTPTTASAATSPSRRPSRTPHVVVLDYGSGNLRSAERALQRVGADVEVTADGRAALEADGLVVPGVGAFAACAAGLRSVHGERLIEQRLAGGRPVLGICVGMQVLFERGVEFGEEAAGAGQWPGTVEKLQADVLPHMGWNTVSAPADSVLFAGMDADTRFYFVHSFGVRRWEQQTPEHFRPACVTWAHHGEDFVAAVENGPLSATQFHPEKSGDAGAALLTNWLGVLR